MSWINVASSRWKLRTEATEMVETWEKTPKLKSLGLNPGLYSAMAGDRDLFGRALKLSQPLLERFHAADIKHLGVVPVVFDAIGLACLAHIEGQDQMALLQRIAQARPFSDSKIARALQVLVSQLVTPESLGQNVASLKPGSVKTEAEWLKLIETVSFRSLLGIALCPDHPMWVRTLRPFVLPLALLIAKTSSNDSFQLLSLGAFPDRHDDVIYERISARPDWGTKPDPRDKSTWVGFDAIEMRNDHAYVYHYLGFGWQAPLVFEGSKLNAFDFLEQLDLSWRLVEETVSNSQWHRIQKYRDSKRCTHVVVHDESVSRYLPAHMERAAEHYGVVLQSMDVLEV